jgi:hypothetical protein
MDEDSAPAASDQDEESAAVASTGESVADASLERGPATVPPQPSDVATRQIAILRLMNRGKTATAMPDARCWRCMAETSNHMIYCATRAGRCVTLCPGRIRLAPPFEAQICPRSSLTARVVGPPMTNRRSPDFPRARGACATPPIARAICLMGRRYSATPVGPLGGLRLHQMRGRLAVTSISMRMRGSKSPAIIIVAAGGAAPKARRSAGQQGSKSARSGKM